MRPPPLAIRARARFEQRVERPLAIRDRRRVERRVTASRGKCGARNFVPPETVHCPQNSREGGRYAVAGSRRLALSFPRHSSQIIGQPERIRRDRRFQNQISARQIAVLGAPIDIGASQRGTLMGPAALRTAGLLTVLDGLGFEVKDHGDLSIGDVAELADAPPDNARHYREIQRWIRALSARAYELARSGAIPIFLGGDHTLSMGSVNGIARHWREAGRELFVVWLDAHADYNTPATTLSGNMHGMSAAFLCGEPGLDGLLGDEPRASDRSRPARTVRHTLDRQAGKGPAARSSHQRRRHACRSTNSASAC